MWEMWTDVLAPSFDLALDNGPAYFLSLFLPSSEKQQQNNFEQYT